MKKRRWPYIKAFLAFMAPFAFIFTIGFPVVRWIGICFAAFGILTIICTVIDRVRNHEI